MFETGRFMGSYRGRIMTFLADQSGAVLPIATVSLVVLVGFATLAVDLSRVMDLQTQLQKAADAFALAGAAELNGDPGGGTTLDAITRANNAIDNLMSSKNSTVFAGAPVTVSAITYLATLPASDATYPRPMSRPIRSKPVTYRSWSRRSRSTPSSRRRSSARRPTR